MESLKQAAKIKSAPAWMDTLRQASLIRKGPSPWDATPSQWTPSSFPAPSALAAPSRDWFPPPPDCFASTPLISSSPFSPATPSTRYHPDPAVPTMRDSFAGSSSLEPTFLTSPHAGSLWSSGPSLIPSPSGASTAAAESSLRSHQLKPKLFQASSGPGSATPASTSLMEKELGKALVKLLLEKNREEHSGHASSRRSHRSPRETGSAIGDKFLPDPGTPRDSRKRKTVTAEFLGLQLLQQASSTLAVPVSTGAASGTMQECLSEGDLGKHCLKEVQSLLWDLLAEDATLASRPDIDCNIPATSTCSTSSNLSQSGKRQCRRQTGDTSMSEDERPVLDLNSEPES